MKHLLNLYFDIVSGIGTGYLETKMTNTFTISEELEKETANQEAVAVPGGVPAAWALRGEALSPWGAAPRGRRGMGL